MSPEDLLKEARNYLNHSDVIIPQLCDALESTLQRLALSEAVCRAAAELDRVISMHPDLTVPGKFRCEQEAITTRHTLFHALKAWRQSQPANEGLTGEGEK